ncbi:MAG: hypothetical protein WBD75_07050 [Phycisphaerae bacterium]
MVSVRARMRRAKVRAYSYESRAMYWQMASRSSAAWGDQIS